MLHQIGAGALGPVFRAYDAQRECLVAVKLFNLDLPPEKVHQLVAEFEHLIAAELTHPALAAPLATGITGVSAFLAQDYVAAESLDLAVREYGAAPPADAVRVAAQLAAALDFAAVVNIGHGALHPRDVLLSSDDTRLTGIGVARALDAVGVTAPVRRPYCAPECLAGAAWDRRADVFSLAALIHELLWARRVSGIGAHAAESLTDIEGGNLAGLRAAFARALAEDPLERFETALEFAQALKDAFPGVTLSSPRSSGRSRPSAAGRQPSKRGLATADREPQTALEPQLPLDLPARDQPPAFNADEVFKTSERTPDLDLHAAEAARYEHVEPAPAIRVSEAVPPDAPPAVSARLMTSYEPEPLSPLERSRSAVWPLVLALTIGLAMGFAGGYGIGSRERTAASVAGAAPAPAGREFTEGAVVEPPKAVTTTVPAPTAGTTNAANAAATTPATPTPPADAAAAADVGRLLVRSTPAGAQVFVDGREYGRTPVAVGDLARGAHSVRVARDGYVTEERRVVITRARAAQSMTVPLLRTLRTSGPESRGAGAMAPALAAPGPVGRLTGLLTVESRPAGAKVYVDDKLLGTTPVSLQAVSAGEHAIRLERDGYRRWSSSVRIVASEQNRVTASLER